MNEHPQARYDWFAASADYEAGELVDGFSRALKAEPRTVRAKNGYTHGVGLFLGEDPEVTIEYSGTGVPHIRATGFRAQRVFEITRDRFPHYALARADVAIDFDDADWFEVIHGTMRRLSHERGIRHHIEGDWETPGHPHGRTTYAGALGKSAVVRRLYEFSKAHGYGHPVRLEIELKPPSRSKRHYACMSPIDVVRSDGYTVEVLRRIGIDVGRIRVAEGIEPPPTSPWFDHLCLQYGAKLREYIGRQLDGCIDDLGMSIIRREEELLEHRRRVALASAHNSEATITAAE